MNEEITRIRDSIAIATQIANEHSKNKADWDSTFIHALKGALANDGIDLDLSGRDPLPRDWRDQMDAFCVAVRGGAPQ